MKNTHTALALILDRSGSMSSCLETAISATNTFLADQKSAEGTADLTITLFDDRIETPFEATDIQNIPDFTTQTFIPRGGTALLDAIGHSIDTLGQKLAALPENDRPGTVIIAILTDGEENSSIHETWATIRTKIRHQEDSYHWTFLFLAAGEDAIAQAAQMGINQANASAFSNDAAGINASYNMSSGKIKSIRAKAHRSLNEEEQHLYSADLNTLIQEETKKTKKS